MVTGDVPKTYGCLFYSISHCQMPVVLLEGTEREDETPVYSCNPEDNRNNQLLKKSKI